MTPIEEIRAAVENEVDAAERDNGSVRPVWAEAALELAEWLDYQLCGDPEAERLLASVAVKVRQPRRQPILDNVAKQGAE